MMRPHRSLELKAEYDEAKLAQEKAVENSTSNFNRRRGINSEIKQFKEQKEEVKRYEKLRAEKVRLDRRSRVWMRVVKPVQDDTIIQHAVWKLYHVEKGIASKRQLVEEKNESVRGLRDEQVSSALESATDSIR